MSGVGCELEWVNHASYVLRHGDVALMTDPWLSGSAFNDGWDLVAPSVFQVQDFDRITHIWISHEHPDHFSPGTLKSIKPEIRNRLTLCYQKTEDRKVLGFCEKLGFKTLELIPNQWTDLGEKFRVFCGQVPFFDSWLLTEVNGVRVLNLNDCVVSTENRAAGIFQQTGPVSVLLCQFSYANWTGNRDDSTAMQRAASERLERIGLAARVFKPEYIVPFASYIYFSHRENAYLNEFINTPGMVLEFIRERTTALPVILYPGDRWSHGSPHESQAAIQRYSEAYREATTRLRESASTSVGDLLALGRSYAERISSKNSRLFFFLFRFLGIVGPVTIKLWDLEQSFVLDIYRGLTGPIAAPDGSSQNGKNGVISTHSSSLAYLLRFEWGFDTLMVNGRFRADRAAYSKVVRTLSIATLNNTGKRLGIGLFLNMSLIRRALSKFMQVSAHARDSRSKY